MEVALSSQQLPTTAARVYHQMYNVARKLPSSLHTIAAILYNAQHATFDPLLRKQSFDLK